MRVERPPARRQRGTGLVEFALVFPLIVALTLSILNGAWYVSASSATTSAAREGARYGVAGSHPCTAAGVSAAARAQMGSFAGAAAVTAASGSDGDGTYCRVTVSVVFVPFAGIWPFPSTTVGDTAQEYAN